MIRNFLFSFAFFSGIIFISIIFLPSLLLPQKITLLGGKLMGYWSQCCLKIILSTDIVIKGKDNMINDEKFFIASSHQSMFETFFLQTIFNSPIFILKNELMRIPVFGWYLKKIGSISIKRDKITKDNLNFFENVSEIIHNTKVAKVSIVGAGMVSTPGVTYRMFRALSDEKINILAISTSEIKLSVIIEEDDTLKAIKKLHTIFDLD